MTKSQAAFRGFFHFARRLVSPLLELLQGVTTNSPVEIAAAIASKPAGSEVTVGYMAKTAIASFRKDVKVTLKYHSSPKEYACLPNVLSLPT